MLSGRMTLIRCVTVYLDELKCAHRPRELTRSKSRHYPKESVATVRGITPW